MGSKAGAWLPPVSSHLPWDGPSPGPSQQLGPDSQALVPWGTSGRAGISLSLTQLLALLPTRVTATHGPAKSGAFLELNVGVATLEHMPSCKERPDAGGRGLRRGPREDG